MTEGDPRTTDIIMLTIPVCFREVPKTFLSEIPLSGRADTADLLTELPLGFQFVHPVHEEEIQGFHPICAITRRVPQPRPTQPIDMMNVVSGWGAGRPRTSPTALRGGRPVFHSCHVAVLYPMLCNCALKAPESLGGISQERETDRSSPRRQILTFLCKSGMLATVKLSTYIAAITRFSTDGCGGV